MRKVTDRQEIHMRISGTGSIYTRKTNYMFLLIAVFLSAIGIFFINDFTSDSYLVVHSYAIRQIAALLLGLFYALIISNIDYHLYSFWALPFLGVLSLLSFLGRYQIFPDIFQLKDYVYLQISDISINLSEPTLLAVCLVISLIVYKNNNLDTTTFLLLGMFLLSFLLSNIRIALIVLAIAVTMIFLKKPLIAALYSLALLAASFFSYIMTCYSDYAKNLGAESRKRMDMWLNPANYDWNTGYGIGQSMRNIACGGILGMGIGAGRADGNLSNEVLDTYILSGIIGEIGWLGIIFILMIYLMFFWEGVKIANKTTDKFGYYLASVINIKFIVTLVLNMFISVNVLPYIKNSPPFIGYSRTRLVIDFISVGIMLNISRQNPAVYRR